MYNRLNQYKTQNLEQYWVSNMSEHLKTTDCLLLVYSLLYHFNGRDN